MSLEALSESPDLSVDPTVLNVRKDLIRASTPQLSRNLTPHSDGLSEYFRRFGLNEEQVERLIPLAQAWERQKTALVRIAAREAPRWEKDYELFWGAHKQPNVPSMAIARAWRLICEVEDTTVSAMRRRLLLVSIDETIETEANKLSGNVSRLRIIHKELDKVARRLSKEKSLSETRLRAETGTLKRRRTEDVHRLQRQKISLTEEQERLNGEVRRYPEGGHFRKREQERRGDEDRRYPEGKHFRQRVIERISNDILDINEVPEGDRMKEEGRFTDHARLGGKYRRFRPLGILFFLGETSSRR